MSHAGRLPASEVGQAPFLLGIALLQSDQTRLQRLDLGTRGDALQLEAAQAQADLLLGLIDRSNGACLDAPDLAPDADGPRQRR